MYYYQFMLLAFIHFYGGDHFAWLVGGGADSEGIVTDHWQETVVVEVARLPHTHGRDEEIYCQLANIAD